MSSLQNKKVKKVKELSKTETLLLTQVQSLQIKNIMLELRLLRMEQHFDQLIKHTNFPADTLCWGQKPLMSIVYILLRVLLSYW